MRIAVLIPSRNRPRLLSAAITALKEMESGENEVEYLVGHDEDDQITSTAIAGIFGIRSIEFGYRTGYSTIGAIWNKLAAHIKSDIYSCMIDDAFPITPHWDKAMAEMASQYEAFTWHEVSAPTNCGYPTCTKAWLDKVGYIVPEHFPYWFCDSWFAELVWFTKNTGVPVSHSLALYSKQEATQNMRDLGFWWKFFNATRPLRVLEAHKIAGGNMSIEDFTASRLKWIALGEARDSEFIGKPRLADIEAKRGVLGEPSARYLAAKVRAEKFLVDNGLAT